MSLFLFEELVVDCGLSTYCIAPDRWSIVFIYKFDGTRDVIFILKLGRVRSHGTGTFVWDGHGMRTRYTRPRRECSLGTGMGLMNYQGSPSTPKHVVVLTVIFISSERLQMLQWLFHNMLLV